MSASRRVAADASALAAQVARIRSGERSTVARAITAIENGLATAEPLLAALESARGRAHVVGVTGAPGAGKSTLINALVKAWSAGSRSVAVLAVDPSSPISGGAVLGDRIRMGEVGTDPRVFIRSLASRGHLGGVARTTRRVVDLVDAAGFDIVVVETVGAGQSEVEIASLADTSVVVCAPGLGDDVQAIKAGILEIADVLVVSKCDSPLAGRTQRDLEDMLRLRPATSGWRVPVLPTTASVGEGIAALADAIAAHRAATGFGRRLADAAAPRALRHSPSGRSVGPASAPGSTPSSAGAPDADRSVDGIGAQMARLFARDAFVRHCRIECVEVAAGTATLHMRVGREHLNFNGTCHGGATFALADSAFGLASNSHGRVAAGIDAHITYHVAVREGDTLTARATEVARNPKLAVYRIDVTRGDGTCVASFTGTVFVTGRAHAAAHDTHHGTRTQ